MSTFHPSAPQDAISDSRAARRELDAMIEAARPHLDATQYAELCDAVNDFEATVRMEFLSRLLALGTDALDVSEGPGERARPSAIATPWLAEPERTR